MTHRGIEHATSQARAGMFDLASRLRAGTAHIIAEFRRATDPMKRAELRRWAGRAAVELESMGRADLAHEVRADLGITEAPKREEARQAVVKPSPKPAPKVVWKPSPQMQALKRENEAKLAELRRKIAEASKKKGA